MPEATSFPLRESILNSDLMLCFIFRQSDSQPLPNSSLCSALPGWELPSTATLGCVQSCCAHP